MPASDLVNLSGLMDDAKCFAFVRQRRWPEGVQCPGCDSPTVALAKPEVCAGTGATTRSRLASVTGARRVRPASTISPARCWPGTTSRRGCGCCARMSWA